MEEHESKTAPQREVVVIRAQDFRLPEVARHIEAGRIVRVVPESDAALAASKYGETAS
jgi:hypothetical protein